MNLLSSTALAPAIVKRWYQDEAIGSIYNYFGNGGRGNPVIALPTGTGKTIVIAGFAESVLRTWPTQRIMVLTHVKELIEQNYNKFVEIWPTANVGINSAALGRRDFNASIIFGGIGSVANYAAEFGHIDLLIIDEAHRVNPKEGTQYHDFIQALKLKNPRLKVIGLSATIYRQGMGYITDDGLFTDVIYDATTPAMFARFIAEGFLAPLFAKRTHFEIDASTVQIVKGEYNQKQLQSIDDIVLSERVVEGLREFVYHGHSRRSWLLFGSGIDHCNSMAKVLKDWGYPVEAVTNKTPKKLRKEIFDAHKSGELRGMVSKEIATTGYDNPFIDTIGVFRPSRSTSLWVQMLGRGTRPVYAPGYNINEYHSRMSAIQAGGKEFCLVLDFAGNTKALGPIDDPVIPKKKNPTPGEMPVKICPQCDMYNPLTAPACIYCGCEFPKVEKITSKASELPVMSFAEPPNVELFNVDSVYYSKHAKKTPPSLRIDYMCGLQRFTKYVALENPRARGLSIQFWKQHCTAGIECPETVDQALQLTHTLATPARLRVWTNKTQNGKVYPEILGMEF